MYAVIFYIKDLLIKILKTLYNKQVYLSWINIAYVIR